MPARGSLRQGWLHFPNMNAHYFTTDVFTDRKFGGNQLAVFPDASSIPPELMAPIAREFNFSETTFVLPPDEPSHTARVRIFTPGGELPFAGHPTVGTAFVLAHTGAIPLRDSETRIILEEGVGPVPVLIRAIGGRPDFIQLSAAVLPKVTPAPAPPDALAEMVSLSPSDLADGPMNAEVVSCGTPYLFIPLRDRQAVARARIKPDRYDSIVRNADSEKVFVFAVDAEQPGHDVRARMFAPRIGVPEDPATGSACVTLAGYLAARDSQRDGTLRWVVEQGFEMGRPSILEIEADKARGDTTAVRVGGRSVLVCEGTMAL